MFASHPKIIALVAASAVVDVVATTIANHDEISSDLANAVVWGLLLSQNGVIWTWAALGNVYLALRVTLSALTLFAFLGMPRESISYFTSRETLVYVLLLVVMAAAILAVWIPVRLCGVRTLHKGERLQTHPLQFSLRNVMLATMLVAAVAAICKAWWTWAPLSVYIEHAKTYASLALPLAAVSPLMSWTILRVRFSATLLLLVCPAIYAAVLIETAIIGLDDSGLVHVVLIYAACSFVWLFAVRLCGYRIVLCRRPDQDGFIDKEKVPCQTPSLIR
jgi:hypothetical protein